MNHTFTLVDPDIAAEQEMAIDVDNHAGDLAKVTEGMPTLLERFLTDPETFCDWVGDAGFCCHDEMTIAAMRPMFEEISINPTSTNYEALGHFFYSLVMSHMETASREAM